jgi:Protein of unknown function (DUF1236)
MKKLLDCLAILYVTSTISHAQSPTVHIELSIDQQIKISEMVANLESQPLTNVNFAVAIGVVVPQNIALHPLPRDVETWVPQLRGDSYIAVEELVAIVDTPSRKIISVMQRMRRQGDDNS